MYLLRILRAGAIATLYFTSVECLSCVKGGVRIRCSAFVVGTPSRSSVAWKRTRGSRTAIAPTAALSAGRQRTTSELSLTASRTGSFTASSAERRFRFGVGLDRAERQRDVSKRNCRGTSMLGIEFHPPDWDTLVGAFAQAAIIGIVTGGLIPMWTRERILEKEAGLDVDERYEMELDDDDYDDLGGYVCATCGSSNEVECPKCDGKGFFVSESAMPRKCDYCGGLGTVECPDCEDRRERLRKERARRRPPLRLPPGRDNDFPSIR